MPVPAARDVARCLGLAGGMRFGDDTTGQSTIIGQQLNSTMLDLFGELREPAPRFHTVRFEPSGRTVRVESGTPLLDAVRRAGLPIAQSCGGVAVCSWCRVQVLDGSANLSAIEPPEARLIERQGFGSDERASCQAEVLGDVTVTTTYW